MKKFVLCILCVLCIGTVGAMTEQERRAYLQWMQAALQDVPAWTAWQKQTGELPPDFDKLPKSNLLPDPLRFLDGRPVGQTAENWVAAKDLKALRACFLLGLYPVCAFSPAVKTICR